MKPIYFLLPYLALAGLSSCEQKAPAKEDLPETITRVELVFEDHDRDKKIRAIASDPDKDGPKPMTVSQPIVLDAKSHYMLYTEMYNDYYKEGQEGYDATEEVKHDGWDHQVVFGWTAGLFESPAGTGNIGDPKKKDAVAYDAADVDENKLPIGLVTHWHTGEAGKKGTFRTILIHKDPARKDTEFDITFDISIQ